MLGLGEKEDDVLEAMDDLLEAGVHILTLGQYLQPTRNHHPVIDWIHPDQFASYKEWGLKKDSDMLKAARWYARHIMLKSIYLKCN
jgi:lipoic acid synthetase